MPGKLYTPKEATELLPHLAPLLIELRDKFEDAIRIRASLERRSSGNGSAIDDSEERQTLARVDELLARLDRWDVELKDVQAGLVDFPAEIGGREVLLCWKLGEDRVAFWHTREDGYAGRQPIE